MRQEMVSMICGGYSYAKSEMLSNTHTNRASTVTLAAHARRGLMKGTEVQNPRRFAYVPVEYMYVCK